MRQRQQYSACVERLAEEALQSLFHTLGVKSKERAREGNSNLNKIEVWSKSGRNTRQGANRPPGESKPRWDLKLMLVKQILDILEHFKQIQFTHLTQRHPVIAFYHQRHGP